MNERYILPAHLGNQDHGELVRFLALVEHLQVRRYLEIGCRNGDSFYSVMRCIGPGGYGMAIDLPENDGTRARLSAVIAQLGGMDISSMLRFGHSQHPKVIEEARSSQPFDLVMIDADHRYEGVRADWLNYSEFAPVVAFHDVAAPDGHKSDGYPCEVPKLWKELRPHFKTEEIVTPGSKMGFGILYREKRREAALFSAL